MLMKAGGSARLAMLLPSKPGHRDETTMLRIWQRAHFADQKAGTRVHRWKGPERYLVVSTLSDFGWPDGYEIAPPAVATGNWREIFSSDATLYDGDGVTNDAGVLVHEGSSPSNYPRAASSLLRHMPQN